MSDMNAISSSPKDLGTHLRKIEMCLRGLSLARTDLELYLKQIEENAKALTEASKEISIAALQAVIEHRYAPHFSDEPNAVAVMRALDATKLTEIVRMDALLASTGLKLKELQPMLNLLLDAALIGSDGFGFHLTSAGRDALYAYVETVEAAA